MFVPRVTKFGTSDDFEAPRSETDSGSKRSKVKVTSACLFYSINILYWIHQMARPYANSLALFIYLNTKHSCG